MKRIRKDKSVYNPKYNERRKLSYRRSLSVKKNIAKWGTFTTPPPPPPPPPPPIFVPFNYKAKISCAAALQWAPVEKFEKLVGLVCAGKLLVLPSPHEDCVTEKNCWGEQLKVIGRSA